MPTGEVFVALWGGFVGHRHDDADAWTFVRFRVAEDQRLMVTLVVVGAQERSVNSNDLRAVPLSRIEVFANGSGRERLLERIEEKFDLDDAVGDRLEDEQDIHRKRAMRATLRVPSGNGRHPDAFYQRVADLYLSLAQYSSRPAADIAETNNINVGTVHRWLKEARRRNILSPGRAGKVG